MTEPTATKKTRTVRPGFKHVYVEVTDAHYSALEQAALEDDRKGGAPEMLSVLLKRNLGKLIPAPWTSAPTSAPTDVTD